MLQSVQVTLSSLSSENVSTMMPNTMFRPMVVTMMKKVKSKKTDLSAASLKLVDILVAYKCMRVCDELSTCTAMH